MISVVKMLIKGEVGGRSLDSHGNYIVDHGKSWKNHGIVFLNFCGNPALDRKRRGLLNYFAKVDSLSSVKIIIFQFTFV